MWVAEGFSLETGLMAGLCYRRQGRKPLDDDIWNNVNFDGFLNTPDA